ncbi:N-carbamoyl-D-amino-acid hydrolase [Halomonas urumqiensis]|uniref:N-carbamoyl-D-amino-acid hydrolase n=1 Tax=Halomonas urumqiensis TaxID=1684789 RepID=A0A2N7UD11_9GAMM|nr:N-carbamoyl-D-amino-acid hydrolase [Halomonas urumqiensis]PMR78319.1 N-carbamoyl-D-amino-acid hydrolase [Halomonas urumqiensis]PTB03466.1 N-carbamoyl-D-amino-acid hydrolase [Halomonas urumqiensis]GHE20349.1 N-carbamoyl-D-amino-acid hydrolase [Halomonas urumqiensis]
MSRKLMIGAAQLGPITRSETRDQAVARMVALMHQAKARGVELVVFPELALTTFFPRWYFEDQDAIDAFFEREVPGPATQPLFDTARELGIGFYLGYAELVDAADSKQRYNTSILVDGAGHIVGKYRKVHLPGHSEHEPWRSFQHLEKRYFEPGQEGFETWQAFGGTVGMAICNDRRWPETYRMLALQGAELMLLGYNTPIHYPPVPEHDHLQGFHNHLCMQAGAYQNGMWVVAVAKAGREEGCELLGQSCIISPTGEIVAMASTLGDELITYECDLDRTKEIRDHIFNFSLHRRPELYGLIAKPSR